MAMNNRENFLDDPHVMLPNLKLLGLKPNRSSEHAMVWMPSSRKAGGQCGQHSAGAASQVAGIGTFQVEVLLEPSEKRWPKVPHDLSMYK